MSIAVRLTLLLFAVAVVMLGVPTPSAEGATVTIDVGDTWFCDSSHNIGLGGTPCDTNISVGDTVSWNWTGILPHTATECGTNWSKLSISTCVGADWDSPTQSSGSFQQTFNTAGTFYYLCEVHPTQMRGRIIVSAAVGGIAELPDMAGTPLDAPDSSGGNTGLLAAVIAAATAGALKIGGAAWYARKRWLL